MTAYYNEIDPKAAAWLWKLINAGAIAAGVVDERSIEDIKPDELSAFTQCHFFAGIGVWSYALRQAGWPDDRPVWTGSCPCQPFSSAGKRGGVNDERHLWPAWQYLIGQHRPAVIFGEQVASKDGLAWLDTVHADLGGSGYAVGALDLCAAGVGAPHIRQRLFFVAERLADADDHEQRQGGRPRRESAPRDEPRAESGGCCATGGLAEGTRDGAAMPGPVNGLWASADWLGCRDGKFRPVEPGTFPLVDGAPARVGRLRGYGNAINAEVARIFIESYLEGK